MLKKTVSRRGFVLGISAAAGTLLASCRRSNSVTPTNAPTILPTAPVAKSTATPSPAAAQAIIAAPTPSPSPSPSPSPTPTPAPITVSVWVDPTIPTAWGPIAEQAIAQIAAQSGDGAVDIRRVIAGEQADLSISTTKPANGNQPVSLAKMALVPVCSSRIPIREISSDQAGALLSGTVTDWADVGSPTSVPVQLFIISGARVDGTSDSATKVANFDEFVGQFADSPGAVAMVPVDDIDFRGLSLIVDGVDLLAEAQSPDEWPFDLDLFLSGTADSAPMVENFVATPSSEVPATAPPLTVSWVGDVILGRTVHTIMTRLNDYQAPFRLVADELKGSDLTIANLECSLADDIEPPSDPLTFSFMTYTAGADGMSLAGIDAVSQANNHSMNFGAHGMRDTLAALDQHNIKHFGIGENLEEARKPTIFDVQGRKIAILGYDGITGGTYGATDSTAGTCPLDIDIMAQDISAVRQQADLVIPFVHWGIEYQLVPNAEQQMIARNAIDVGADMVIGSHCHWVQGMEVYKGKPIIYSLANFVFDQDWSLETKQGLIMHLVFRQNRVAAIRFVPVLIEDFYQPHIVDGSDMTQILDRIWQSTDLIAAGL
ncbi:MAG: CapA family protein [Nitrolancea sp.]